MSELVDKLMQGTTQPASPGPTSGEGSPTGDGINGGSKGKGRDERISQLTDQRRQAVEQLQSIQAENMDLRERMANLEGRVQHLNVNDQSPPSSFQEMSGGQLSEAWNLSFENNNPQGAMQVTQEWIQRASDKAVQQALEKGGLHLDKRNELQATEQRIVAKFGEEAQRGDSELTKRATQYLQGYHQKYGKDFMLETPHLVESAYNQAWADLNVQAPQRLQELERENERLKQMATMEPGNRYGARLNDESSAALEKGDTRSAIENLSFIKGLAAKAQRE